MLMSAGGPVQSSVTEVLHPTQSTFITESRRQVSDRASTHNINEHLIPGNKIVASSTTTYFTQPQPSNDMTVSFGPAAAAAFTSQQDRSINVASTGNLVQSTYSGSTQQQLEVGQVSGGLSQHTYSNPSIIKIGGAQQASSTTRTVEFAAQQSTMGTNVDHAQNYTYTTTSSTPLTMTTSETQHHETQNAHTQNLMLQQTGTEGQSVAMYATAPVSGHSEFNQSAAAHVNASLVSANMNAGVATRMTSATTDASRQFLSGTTTTTQGAERLISVTSFVDESRSNVISERYVEHQIRVPRKIIREEVIEKTVVIPEKIITEEIVDDVQTMLEKVVEVSKPTIIEKVIEVPEYELRENIVEKEERRVQEKIVEVEVPRQEERLIYKQVPIYKHMDVPKIETREVIKHVKKQVDQEQIQFVERQVAVPQYVDVPVPQEVVKEVVQSVDRHIPVPIEAEVTYEYRLPQMKPRYAKVNYPVYLPRFIEVPVATELLNQDLQARSAQYLGQVNSLTKVAASLCEIEGLAAQIMKTDFQTQLSNVDLQSAVLKAWHSNALPVNAAPAKLIEETATRESVMAMQAPMVSTVSTVSKKSRKSGTSKKHHS